MCSASMYTVRQAYQPTFHLASRMLYRSGWNMSFHF